MFEFFDYLFFKACNFYLKAEKDPNTNRTSGLLVVSLMQGFNLLTIFFIYCLLFNYKQNVNKLYIIIFTTVLLIVNGIKYNKDEYDYDNLIKRWSNEEKNKKDLLVKVYIFLSPVLFFGLAIYLGSKK